MKPPGILFSLALLGVVPTEIKGRVLCSISTACPTKVTTTLSFSVCKRVISDRLKVFPVTTAAKYSPSSPAVSC